LQYCHLRGEIEVPWPEEFTPYFLLALCVLLLFYFLTCHPRTLQLPFPEAPTHVIQSALATAQCVGCGASGR
jgi:hypothetical protein